MFSFSGVFFVNFRKIHWRHYFPDKISKFLRRELILVAYKTAYEIVFLHLKIEKKRKDKTLIKIEAMFEFF